MFLHKLTGLMLMALFAGAVAAEVPAGRVKAVFGEVTAEKDGLRRALNMGDAVYAGERIRTSSAASAALMLQDDTRISLGERASIRVDRFDYDTTKQDGNALITVFRGITGFVSGLLAKSGGDRVRIRTPTATIGVRGTEFMVDVTAASEDAEDSFGRQGGSDEKK